MRAHPQHSSMTTLRRQFAGALLALFMAAFAGAGLAAGLGPINPQSRIGQPFAADIDLINVGRDDFMALKVGLASAASYRAAGLTLDPVLNSLRLTLERRANGAPYIRAITTRRVTEPYLDVLVELSTPDGGIQRAYTVLLDLPDTAQTAVAAAPATTGRATPMGPQPPVRTTPARPWPPLRRRRTQGNAADRYRKRSRELTWASRSARRLSACPGRDVPQSRSFHPSWGPVDGSGPLNQGGGGSTIAGFRAAVRRPE